MLHTTPQERQALGITALLLIAGAGVRIFAAPPGVVEWEGPPADTLLASGTEEVRARAAEALEQERIRNRPLEPGERIDPNRADALQLDRLPRVGAAMAERIVEWREDHGPFGSLADLDAVPGIGPALLEVLAPHLTLPTTAPAATSPRRGAGLDVNRATAAELEALPGIGPSLAERIIASREAEGPFSSVEDLDRVPGIGPALVERLTPLVRVAR